MIIKVNSDLRKPIRLYLIDTLRGIAILAMAIFHFTWDLELFGFVEQGLTARFEWKNFARIIASGFLFLAGVSLMLGHDPEVKIQPFLKRLIQIILAAIAISVASYYTMPDAPIFFGILHSIAVASIIGLVLRRQPVWLITLTAIFVCFAPLYLQSDFFNKPLLWWTGLNTNIPRSSDYVPILPWLAPFLIGMAMAKLAKSGNLFEKLALHQSPPKNLVTRGLGFLGRHSLAAYLLHQPILLGFIWMIRRIL